MELEKQVCSLELAKKLKGLGVKQESVFDWMEYDDMGNKKTYVGLRGSQGFHTEVFCSAFSVAELGELLPDNPEIYHKTLDRKIKYEMRTVIETPSAIDGAKIFSCYLYNSWGGTKHQEIEREEANSRAKMLIYLIEQGVVKP